MEEVVPQVVKAYGQVDDIRKCLDEKEIPQQGVFAEKINVFTDQLAEIKALAKKKAGTASDIDVPVELLNFIDGGAECNPELFQLELFTDTEKVCTSVADRIKRLKELSTKVGAELEKPSDQAAPR